MQAEQIELVRSSFAQLAPRADSVAARFYASLFERRSELRAMFPQAMDEQGHKLMGQALVGTLEGELAEAFTPAVRAAWAQAHAALAEQMITGAQHD